jgi:hypothetical protein
MLGYFKTSDRKNAKGSTRSLAEAGRAPAVAAAGDAKEFIPACGSFASMDVLITEPDQKLRFGEAI